MWGFFCFLITKPRIQGSSKNNASSIAKDALSSSFTLLQTNKMKNFQMFLCFSITFLALALSTANGKVAASLSNLPNIRPYDTRSKVKASRHKRGTVDHCKSFLPKSEKVTSCVPLEDRNPVCTEAECPNKPSYPSKINHAFYLNKTTKKLHLNISWGKPLFGLNNLCGFQIDFASLRSPFGSICTQLNSKDIYTYSIPNVNFNGEYNITITSLPAVKEDIDKSCSFIKVKSEDKCAMLRRLNESLPWKCNVRQNFPVICKNGSINVTLEGLHNTVADFYVSEIISRGQPQVLRTKYTKDQSFVPYSNLTLGAEYYLYITIYKGSQRLITKSEPFICKENIRTDRPSTTEDLSTTESPATGIQIATPDKDSLLLIVLCVVTGCIVLIFVVICVKYKFASELKSLLVIRHHRKRPFCSESSLQPDIPIKCQPRVVFAYPFGCTYLEKLVVLIGQLLTSMGCQCILDLYMEGDRNIFMMREIQKLQRDDYVILFNYRGTSSDSQNALKCHENLICKKRFSHLLHRDNFIAIQFDMQETMSLATSICFASNVRKGLQRLIRIIWGIPRFQFCAKFPQENAVDIDPDVENEILLKVASVNAISHESCHVESCRKGKMPACSSFSNGNATSTNSFGSIFTNHGDVIFDQHVRVELSRLSSSEPLLINT